jgi:hypothetical protein
VPTGLDEEVEQEVLARGRVGEHEAPRAEPGERALGRERHQHRGDGGIESVAALAQHLCPRLGGQVVAGGDDASHRAQPRG